MNEKHKTVDSTPAFIVKAGKLKVAVVERGRSRDFEQFGALLQRRGGSEDHPDRCRRNESQERRRRLRARLRRLSGQLVDQRNSVETANAAYEASRLAREVAEIAVTEYTDGIFKSQLNTLQNELAAAQSAIQRTESRLERTRRARNRLNALPTGNGEAKARADVVLELDMDDRLEDAAQGSVREKMAFELAKTKVELLEELQPEQDDQVPSSRSGTKSLR